MYVCVILFYLKIIGYRLFDKSRNSRDPGIPRILLTLSCSPFSSKLKKEKVKLHIELSNEKKCTTFISFQGSRDSLSFPQNSILKSSHLIRESSSALYIKTSLGLFVLCGFDFSCRFCLSVSYVVFLNLVSFESNLFILITLDLFYMCRLKCFIKLDHVVTLDLKFST